MSVDAAVLDVLPPTDEDQEVDRLSSSSESSAEDGQLSFADSLAQQQINKQFTEFLNSIDEKSNNQQLKKFAWKNVDFEELMGRGAFAEVYRGRLKSTNEEFAFKKMEKKQFQFRQSEQRKRAAMNEATILGMLDHPNLIKMHAILQDDFNLYFVLDLCAEGELFQRIQSIGPCDFSVGQFYVAEIVLALEKLHSLGIIHRDFKPENVLLNARGHVVLTDFGCARLVDEKSGDFVTGERYDRKRESFVGTVGYICPEIMIGNKNNNAAAGYSMDLWSLGCLIYTIFAGHPPFKGSSHQETIEKMRKRDFNYPEGFPEVAMDLIDQLLIVNPAARLGAPPEGYAKLKAHRFFEGVDFSSINQRPAPSGKSALHLISFDSESASSQLSQVQQQEQQQQQQQPEENKWRTFLRDEEKVLLQGFVQKRKGFSSKKRMLILTDAPRLVYIDARRMEQKGEIPWSNTLWAEMKGEPAFHVHTPKRTYYLEAKDLTAQEWVTLINKTNNKHII